MTDTAPRTLEYVPLDTVKPARWNPKSHEAQLIADSIAAHGFVTPMVVDDRTGELVAGHGRRDDLLARRAAGEDPPDGIVLTDDGVWTVPVVRGWRSRNKVQAEQFLVAENATGIAGGWRHTDLADRLGTWAERDQLAGTGYTPKSAEELLAGLRPTPKRPDPIVPDTPRRPVSKVGDVWLLGDGSRLMCGDSTNPDHMAKLMDGAQADLVFTSPPYNVDVEYDGHDDAALPWPEYRDFLAAVVAQCVAHLATGRAFCWNIGVYTTTVPYRQAVILEDAGLQFGRQLIWRKSGVPVPTWHFTLDQPVVRMLTPNWTHELVYLFTKGKLEKAGPAIIDGVLQHDVFDIAQAVSTRDLLTDTSKPYTGSKGNFDRRAQKEHPAVFPIALPRTFIGHLAAADEIVLEPFAGAGSTLLAAQQLGRRGYGMEKSAGYTDVACGRWQRTTGMVPVLERTGKPHDFKPAPD